MKNLKIEVEYLENGKKKAVLVKSSREQVELWNRARKGQISILRASRQEKNGK